MNTFVTDQNYILRLVTINVKGFVDILNSKKTKNKEMEDNKNNIIPYEIAKELKEIGFHVPVPHCFIHVNNETYELELFSYFLGSEGVLSEVYENEKNIREFDINFIRNESEVYFDYNQDIRKLLARIYNGEEYMNDEKSYNMNVNSYTYEKWTPEQEEENKILLPNYNDGDFDFTVYQDIVSAPLYQQVFEFFREKYHLSGCIDSGRDKNLIWYIYTISELTLSDSESEIYRIEKEVYSYEEAQLECLKMLIKLVKK